MSKKTVSIKVLTDIYLYTYVFKQCRALSVSSSHFNVI